MKNCETIFVYPHQLFRIIPFDSGLPVTQISLENGTTVTIPVIPGTQIDVATGTINPGEDESDSSEEEEEIVGEEPDEVESNEESAEPETQNNDKPSMAKPQSNGSPNNGYPNPFANPYLQFPFNAYPNVPPFNPYFGATPQFGAPQNYFNYPGSKKPARVPTERAPEHTPASMKDGNEPTSSEGNSEEELGGGNTENGNVPDGSNGVQTVSTPNKPTKNKINADRVVNNQIPPNFQSPYFNYFNTFNPNQFYQNNANGFNGANANNRPEYQQQFVASNPQFNGFNPYNFPQNANPFGNPQFNGFPNQGVNIKKQNNKNRPHGSQIQPVITNGYKYPDNKKFPPNVYKEVVKPVSTTQNNDDPVSSEEDVENSEMIDDDN